MKNDELNITNYMEALVYEALDGIMEGMGCCMCNHCRMDVAALALNSLTPKYVVTESGKLYAKISLLQQQFDVDVLSAITKAAIIVKQHPRHSNGEE